MNPTRRRWRAIPALLMAAMVALLLPSCSDDPITVTTDFENILLVPDDYPTPQAAVDAAGPRDLVRIRPGVYTHMETRFVDPVEFPRGMRAGLFMRDSVVVQGFGSAGSVVFRDTTGADTTYGVAFIGVSDQTALVNVSVEDFFIGVVMSGSGGSLFCSRVADSGAGVWLFRAERPQVFGNLIEDCEFDGVLNQGADGEIAVNLVRGCGAGVGAELAGDPILQANILCQNRLGFGTNGFANAVLYRNVIIDNEFGVASAGEAVPTIVENDIYGNDIGIMIGFYSDPLVDPIDATSNYWESVDVDEIGLSRIIDRNDDELAGAEVEYLPVSPSSWNPFPFDPRQRCVDLSAPEVMELLRPLAEPLMERGLR